MIVKTAVTPFPNRKENDMKIRWAIVLACALVTHEKAQARVEDLA